jgi:hypothetical protein
LYCNAEKIGDPTGDGAWIRASDMSETMRFGAKKMCEAFRATQIAEGEQPQVIPREVDRP